MKSSNSQLNTFYFKQHKSCLKATLKALSQFNEFI